MHAITIIMAATLVLFFIDIIRVEGRTTDTSKRSYNVQACGKELADLLQAACGLGYNNYNYNIARESDAHDNVPDSGREKRRIKKRGITQECCLQPCKFDDLVAYCYNGSSVNAKRPQNLPELFIQGVNLEQIFYAIKRAAVTVTSSESSESFKNNDPFLAEKHNNIAMASQTIPKSSKLTLTTPVRPHSVARNETGVNGNVKSIPVYHFNKTAIIIDNRSLRTG